MTTVQKVLWLISAQQMFDLVNTSKPIPFLPWCSGTVLSSRDDIVEAEY